MAELIIEYGHKYYLNGLPPIPTFFKAKTFETRKHNDSFIAWFEEHCEVCADAKVSLKLLASVYGRDEKDLKEGMKRMGFKYNKDFKCFGKDESGKYIKGGYEGVKIKENECDEDSEDTEEP